ncbi:MAG: hypothetical protein IJV36_05235 [Prevotella sp.]|nr:hypothetical protein [Prevotella sp.]
MGGEKLFTTIFVLIAGSLFVIGAIFGSKSLYVILPIVFVCVTGMFLYARKKKENSLTKDILQFVNILIVVSIFIFISVGLGNCVGSCTKGGGDTRQQRIEMGLPPY